MYWQLQHQLLVSGADLAHLFVYDGQGGILIEQKPEPNVRATIRVLSGPSVAADSPSKSRPT